jgi:ribulose-5-phosphate 4-epimerase/fuculose-1-phosphate aldolase
MSRELDQVREQVALANRVLAESGLSEGVLASVGHASMRLPTQPDQFVVKGRGYALDSLAVMRGEDMILCDLDGFKIDGPLGSSQCFEVKMHSTIYKMHPEVKSIVHVHPRFTIVMGLLQGDIKPMCNEGNILVNDPLPIFPHQRLILTEEDGLEVAATLGSSRAILLRGHGAATVGGSLEDSVVTMLQLEEQAKMNWYAYCAAGPDHAHVPHEDVVEFAANAARMSQLDHFKVPLAQGSIGGVTQTQQRSIFGSYVERLSRRGDA